MEFASEEDAAASIENMDGAELLGKTIHCKEAKMVRGVGGVAGGVGGGGGGHVAWSWT